ncbi:unnamed protein product [Linum tenue]|uniref:J domain-containing protein n=1 Tax=Linum tenue TaxID=586396 RepID=A0AAV0L0M8_9ROSI|nr:unnamed protein product [Linum tenue]
MFRSCDVLPNVPYSNVGILNSVKFATVVAGASNRSTKPPARSPPQIPLPSNKVPRSTLGLPLSGPLEIEEVKNEFRESALKWHPDRSHQGDSQAAAGL